MASRFVAWLSKLRFVRARRRFDAEARQEFDDHLEQTPDFDGTLVVDIGAVQGRLAAWAVWKSDLTVPLRDYTPTGDPLADEDAAEGRWVKRILLPEHAREFRVTLFDFEGVVLWEAQVSDTIAVLPDSVRLQASTNYFWKVAARGDYGTWVSSGLRQFRVVPGRRP